MNTEFWILELEPEQKTKVIEEGLLLLENFIDAQEAYDLFIVEIQKEWSPEGIRAFLLERKRKSYSWFKDKAAAIEESNCEARQKGVPYAERRVYSRQISALQRLMAETARQGSELKRSPLMPVQAYLRPYDVPFITKFGFERHLLALTR